MPALDVNDAQFEREVLDRSTTSTVVVDLWASWCGPCKVLGPLLEKVVDETPGVDLVKVDVDANPYTSQAFQVQSIPAVFAIKDRKVVDSFVGALPEPAIREWVNRLNPPPTQVDLLIERGDETSLRNALAEEPANERALLALAALLTEEPTDQARRDEALSLLAKLPDSAEARHIAAQARIGAEVGSGSAGDEIEAKLDRLLERVRGDDQARQEFVDLLELLGPADPRTAAYRKALTARLF